MGSWLSRALDLKSIPPLQHRSLHCDIAAVICFKNATNRDVSVYWLDYQGKKRYYALLSPNSFLAQNSFLTHPWTFSFAKDPEYRHVSRAQRKEMKKRQFNLMCSTSQQIIVYPSENINARRVTIVDTPPVVWSTETHAHHFSCYKPVVKTVLLCHKRLSFVETAQGKANLGSLPSALVVKILSLAAPSAQLCPSKPPLPEGATEDWYTPEELVHLFDHPVENIM